MGGWGCFLLHHFASPAQFSLIFYSCCRLSFAIVSVCNLSGNQVSDAAKCYSNIHFKGTKKQNEQESVCCLVLWGLSARLIGFHKLMVWCLFDVGEKKTVGGNFVKCSQPTAINHIITLSSSVLISLSFAVCLCSGWITKRRVSLHFFPPSVFLPLLSDSPTLLVLAQVHQYLN